MTTGAPARQPDIQPESPLKQTLRFFSSMQLGLVLLLVLAAVSAYATFQEMERAIGQIYSSWWFISILSFISLNLLLCTVQRFRPLYRLALQPHKTTTAEDISRMQVHRAIAVKEAAEPLAAAEAAFRANGLRVSVAEGPAGRVVCGEKGRWGYLGSVVSHLSLLVILLGALYGVLTGYEVTNGGWVGSRFSVPEGNFDVEITDIRMEQEDDPTIRPRVYSDVTVSRDGKVLVQDTVSINYPVRFAGNTIYHDTFIYFPQIKLTDLETGETGASRFLEGDRVFLDAGRTMYLELRQFFSNFSMRPDGTPYNVNYRTDRPVAAGELVRDRQQQGVVFLPLHKAQVFETPGGRVEVVMTGYELASVFSVSKNLGRPYLFAGSLLLIIGLYMSFFIIPERYYAFYAESNGTLLLGGRGYRSRLGIAGRMERMEAQIKRREESKSSCQA
ncbi:MAG: cytochrome c biogenesis protein ResB [Dethiobacter sp.]|nr:cytochrome c biogenesis protein ResB [Dethiobacter sp.]MCL5982866.1 cytochrome c biogenesis protein ResB [Bacillota bacterium]